jgi:hypothetical protein
MSDNETRKMYYAYLIEEWKQLCNSGMPQPLIERSFPLIVKPYYYFVQENAPTEALEPKPGGTAPVSRPVYGKAKEGGATPMQQQIISDRMKRPTQAPVVETFFTQFGVSSVDELKFNQAKIILDALGVRMKAKG